MGRRSKHESNRPSQNSHLLKLNIIDQQQSLPLSKSSVKRAAEALCDFLAIPGDELSLFFVSEKKISALHAQFFDDPSPTDCMTFPPEDLFICPAVAISYAARRKLDPYRETLLYLVHALLHLCGYDDQKSETRRTMRKMEKKCMDHLSKLGIKLTSS